VERAGKTIEQAFILVHKLKRRTAMSKITRTGDYVSLTIYDISAELLHEFSEYVVKPHYPGGIGPAIKDLMRKAVQEQKQKEEKNG